MIYEAKCPICGKVSKLEVDDTAYMAYKAGIGKIQRLFPDLKPEEHELIQTGICNTCWNLLFRRRTMTNEELKKKIIEIIKRNGTYNGRSLSFDYYVIQPDDLADALIAAGIGDVKEIQHRTEVTEWALRAVSFRLTRMCYPECPKEWERLMIECEDHWKWQAEQVIAKKQAEKKIAEEKKDD